MPNGQTLRTSIAAAAFVLVGFAAGGLLGTGPRGLFVGAALAAGGAVIAAWLSTRRRPDVPSTLAEALADRYLANFVYPVTRALSDDDNAALDITSIRILIPARAGQRDALTRAVTDASTPADVVQGGGQRSFGVYVYEHEGQRDVVDVPSTLRGLADLTSGGGSGDGRRAYARFAERLRDVLDDDPPSIIVRVETGVASFPTG